MRENIQEHTMSTRTTTTYVEGADPIRIADAEVRLLKALKMPIKQGQTSRALRFRAWYTEWKPEHDCGGSADRVRGWRKDGAGMRTCCWAHRLEDWRAWAAGPQAVEVAVSPLLGYGWGAPGSYYTGIHQASTGASQRWPQGHTTYRRGRND